MVIGKHICGSYNGFMLDSARDKYRFYVSSNPFLTGTSTYRDGNWHFVVAVHNGSTMYLYVDGELENSMVKSHTNTNSINISIGRASSGCGFFEGMIDDVRIYNRSLSESEIQELYSTAWI